MQYKKDKTKKKPVSRLRDIGKSSALSVHSPGYESLARLRRPTGLGNSEEFSGTLWIGIPGGIPSVVFQRKASKGKARMSCRGCGEVEFYRWRVIRPVGLQEHMHAYR
jgi:hypothetical protein